MSLLLYCSAMHSMILVGRLNVQIFARIATFQKPVAELIVIVNHTCLGCDVVIVNLKVLALDAGR